jgi:hypothetical protein
MAFTDVWDATFESEPTNSTYGYMIDDYIRRVQTGVRERMEIDHVWKVGVNDGYHKKVTLLAQATAPVAVAGYGIFYTKDVGSGVIELFYKDAAGNEKQITSAGTILFTQDDLSNPAFSSDVANLFLCVDYVNNNELQWYEDFDRIINIAMIEKPTAWRFFYSGASGVIREIALSSSSGTPLVSKGATSAPEFDQIATAGIEDGAVTEDKIGDEAVTGAKLLQPTAAGTEIYLAKAETERVGSYWSYTKMKETQPLTRGGAVRVSFQAYSATSPGKGKVYKNGVAAGAEHTIDTDSYSSAFTDDITVATGDVIQVYLYHESGIAVLVKNLYVMANDPYCVREATGL